MTRIYAVGFILLAGVLAWWRYDYVTAQNAALKTNLEAVSGVLNAERINAQEAANNALAAKIEESKREKEHQEYIDCVAAGKCGARVRYQSCPAVPDTGSSESESARAAAELDRQFQQWVNNHTALIIKYEQRVKALEAEDRRRANRGYCQPK